MAYVCKLTAKLGGQVFLVDGEGSRLFIVCSLKINYMNVLLVFISLGIN